MKKVIAAINMTVDGFCDHTSGVPDEEIHRHYTDLLRSAGAALYGRISYQLMEYWRTVLEHPTGNTAMDDFAIAINDTPKIVFSRTLENVNWRTASLADRDLEKEVLELKHSNRGNDAGGHKDILVCSPSLIVQLTNLNLIDQYQLCIHPVIAGRGLPLFKNISEKILLTLKKTKLFSGGAIILYYEPLTGSTIRGKN